MTACLTVGASWQGSALDQQTGYGIDSRSLSGDQDQALTACMAGDHRLIGADRQTEGGKLGQDLGGVQGRFGAVVEHGKPGVAKASMTSRLRLGKAEASAPA